MFFELINDLFVHSSIFYLFFGVIIATIGMIQLFSTQQSIWKTRTNLLIDEHKHLKIKAEHISKPITVNQSYITWFISVYKRLDKRDGKKDSSSYNFKVNFKIIGGEIWKKATYSRPLNVFDFSL